MINVRPVTSADVRPLRSLVLRPGQPAETLVYDGDDHPLALHAGAFSDGLMVGIATVYPEEPPGEHRDAIPADAYGSNASFRLRGMAVHPDFQGRGVGKEVLSSCFDHVRTARSRFLWCNARLRAVPFYESMGLEAVGELFDIPGIGPHYVMWTDV